MRSSVPASCGIRAAACQVRAPRHAEVFARGVLPLGREPSRIPKGLLQ